MVLDYIGVTKIHRQGGKPMKRSLAIIMLTLFALSLLSGCNTVRGAGEDIERGGEAIQRSAD